LIVGLESALTLLAASEPTAYLEDMSYKFFYSELGGSGIDNLTGDVFIYVNFQGEIVDLGEVSILDYSLTEPGNYSIQFSTTIFDRTGIIYMNVYVNWSLGVAPFYQNRTDVISVRILPRDTLVSITPPSPVAYLEDAFFTFTYEDIAGEVSSYITDMPALTVASNITFSYSEAAGTFQFDFNTAQFVSLGLKAIRLDLTWAGAPFYVNRTGIIVFITILERTTFLEYLTPPPTQYADIVQFNVTWTDVAGVPYTGIEGATLSLWGASFPVPSMYYNWSDAGGGVYSVSLSATFSSPATYTLRVRLALGSFYISDVDVARQFTINERLTLLSAEPVRDVPYSSPIEVILYFQDLFTVTSIDNDSSDVTLEILTSGVWFYTVSWEPTNEYYLVSIQTDNHPELLYGIIYSMEFRMTYSDVAPYYSSDTLTVDYELRIRESTLELDTAPSATAYQNIASFTLFYNDDDADSGIANADITVLLNSTELTQGLDYTLTQGLAGFYTFDVDTTALVGLGLNTLVIYMNWIGSPYHENLTTSMVIIVRERSTVIEFTQPPSQTQYLENVIFRFVFKDLDTGVPGGTAVFGLTSAEIRLFCENSTEVNSGLFTVTAFGDEYQISIGSIHLSNVLDSDYALRLDVDWNDVVVPYYSDRSSTVRVSIVGRTMLVTPSTIQTTPITGPLGTENMTLEFTVVDASNSNPVEGVIIGFDCQEDSTFTYWISPGIGPQAGEYTIYIDTDTLTDPLGPGTYHFELEIMWNPLLAPYYSDRPVIVLSGVIDEVYTNLQAEAPSPAAPYIGENVSIIINYVDLDHGSIGIDGATITAEYASGASITFYNYYPTGTPGEYLLVFNTTDITEDGSYTLRITAIKPDYATLIVQPTITIQKIPTELELPAISYTVRWTNTTRIFVYFNDTLHNSPISGATVTWSYGPDNDNFIEFPGTGMYYYDITANLDDAGTWVLSIFATSPIYQISTATITLVVLPLPSQMDIRIPDVAVQNVPRGDPVGITVYLSETIGGAAIDNAEVNRVYIAFQGYEILMSPHINGSNGYWEGSIPGVYTGVLDPRGYSVRVIAEFNNYELAANQFGIYIEQIRTQVSVWNDATGEFTNGTIEFVATYLEVVNFTVEVSAPAYAELIDNSTVTWFESRWGIAVNFTNLGGGLYQFLFNTSQATFGVYGVTFTATYPESPLFAEDAILVTLIVQEIPTTVYEPILQPVYWGWKGNFSFTYYDTHYDRGIENATVTYSYLSLQNQIAFDIGNGVYYIYIDTSIMLPSVTTLYPILVTFQKGDGTYETATSGVSLQVLEVPTEILLNFTGAIGGFTRFDGNVKVYELEVAYGGTVELEMFYNDTDLSDGFIGGIEGSFTNLTQLGGNNMFLKYPLLTEMGSGWYSYSFETLQSWLFDAVGGEPAASPGNPYTFTVTLWLANRTARSLRIQITIIEVPTTIEVTDFILNIGFGVEGSITLRYWDTWNDVPVTGANITTESSNDRWVRITGVTETSPGLYQIRFVGYAEIFDILRYQQRAEISFTIFKDNYAARVDSDLSIQLEVVVNPNPTETMLTTWFPVLMPLGLFLMVLIGLYVRVWSVPKRLRQINAQIKAIRKGKIPKPIAEAKGRQELIAELFNDTFLELKLKRRPEQMPLESIEVAVPEMGELLIQLSILTNLSPEELDEFQADIAKMRISEQAAFVKEVIMQEAIRAARRDGITVDEVIEKVQVDARARLAGESEGVPPVDVVVEPEHDAVVLVEEEVEVEVKEKVTPKDFEEEVTTDDRLSPYEIEELRKELEGRGVPPHEIDTIIEQAKVLPRDLVDELVKSLGKE
jgi:hypothetical protein